MRLGRTTTSSPDRSKATLRAAEVPFAERPHDFRNKMYLAKGGGTEGK